jgi:predicted Zn-dependent protease
MALVRDAVRRGDLTQALSQSTALRDKMPDVPQVALLHALVLNSAGRADDALTELQALTKATPQFEQGWLALVNMQRAQGNETAAEASLAAALEAMPTSRTMRWMQAGDLERSGDVEGAIALYEVLYAEDSNWAIVANNLASLLANNRSDAESLERAYVIARRLRGIEVPAFQDTYGWIAFRRGNLDEALAHLEPAARGLPGDMSVQYHLAMAYGATGRRDEALVLLKRVAEANPAPAPALLAAVQAEIARLEATPAATGNTSGGTQGN